MPTRSHGWRRPSGPSGSLRIMSRCSSSRGSTWTATPSSDSPGRLRSLSKSRSGCPSCADSKASMPPQPPAPSCSRSRTPTWPISALPRRCTTTKPPRASRPSHSSCCTACAPSRARSRIFESRPRARAWARSRLRYPRRWPGRGPGRPVHRSPVSSSRYRDQRSRSSAALSVERET